MFIISFILNCPFKLKGPDDCKSILSIISGKIHTGIFSVHKTLVMKRYFHFLCLMLLRTSQVLSQKSKLLSSRHHSSFCKLLFATEGPSEHHSLAMKGHIIKKKIMRVKKRWTCYLFHRHHHHRHHWSHHNQTPALSLLHLSCLRPGFLHKHLTVFTMLSHAELVKIRLLTHKSKHSANPHSKWEEKNLQHSTRYYFLTFP